MQKERQKFKKQSLKTTPMDLVTINNAIKYQTFKNFFINWFTGELCQEDLEAIKSWTTLWIDDYDKLIMESGKDELRSIGQRYKQRLPEIFDAPYNTNDITVKNFN